MKRKFLSLFATIAILCNLCCFTTVSAQYTVTGEEIILYKTDFDAPHQFDGAETDNRIKYVGGWDKSGNGAFQAWSADGATPADGNYGFIPGSAPKVVKLRNGVRNGTSEFHIPRYAIYNTGTYRVYFDLYRGVHSGNDQVMLCDKAAFDRSSHQSLALYTIDSGMAKGSYYSVVLTFNLDNNTITVDTYNSDGTLRVSNNSTYSWTRDYLRYMSFEFMGDGDYGTDSDPSANAYGFVSMIDNFKVTYQKAGVSQTKVVGNIYATDFSEQFHDFSGVSSTGGWELYSKSHAGVARGKDGSFSAFCPYGAPYNAVDASYSGCAYYLKPEDRMVSGIYKINYDINVGANCESAGVYFHAVTSPMFGQGAAINTAKTDAGADNGSKGLTIGRLTDYAEISRNVWYNVDVTIDLDKRECIYNVFNPDGSLCMTWTGPWVYYHKDNKRWTNAPTLSVVEFYGGRGSAVAKDSNTDLDAANSFRIDNFSINYYDGALPIYRNDFDDQDLKPNFTDVGNKVGGGIGMEATTAFISDGNGGYYLGYIHADGKSVSARENGTEYYIPQSYKRSTGVYKVSFKVKPGNKSQTLKFPFCGLDSYDKNYHVTVGDIPVGSGGLTRGSWYRVELTVDLDRDTASIVAKALDANGSHVSVAYSNSISIASDQLFRYVALRHYNTATGTFSSSDGPVIDDFEVNYYTYGRAEAENFDFYNSIDNEFQTGATKLGSGTWDISGSAKFVEGGIDGSSYALSPSQGKGFDSTAGSGGSTEYWLPAEDVSTMGQYHISFWYRGGTNMRYLKFQVGGLDSFERDNNLTLYSLETLPAGKWYNVEAVVDIDIYRYNVRIKDAEGNLYNETEGNVTKTNFPKVTYFSWYGVARNAMTQTAESCALIDDVYIAHNPASVDDKRVYDTKSSAETDATQGIKFGATSVTYQAKVFNDMFINNSSNTKHYKAFLGVYDGEGNLVYFHQGNARDGVTNDYYTTAGSTLYTNLPNGTGDGYTYRMFLWNTGNTLENTALSKVVEATK